jgi:hypothetical protein
MGSSVRLIEFFWLGRSLVLPNLDSFGSDAPILGVALLNVWMSARTGPCAPNEKSGGRPSVGAVILPILARTEPRAPKPRQFRLGRPDSRGRSPKRVNVGWDAPILGVALLNV